MITKFVKLNPANITLEELNNSLKIEQVKIIDTRGYNTFTKKVNVLTSCYGIVGFKKGPWFGCKEALEEIVKSGFCGFESTPEGAEALTFSKAITKGL